MWLKVPLEWDALNIQWGLVEPYRYLTFLSHRHNTPKGLCRPSVLIDDVLAIERIPLELGLSNLIGELTRG